MRRILLGLTGSVSTVLYAKLIEQLQAIGPVDVILTEKSIPFISMSRLCDALEKGGGLLYTEEDEWKWKHLYNDDNYPENAWYHSKKWEKNDPVLHIELRNNHSAFVIAPCSANTLAKLANGICDNLLTSVARAWDRNRPFVIAPAMNTTMWEHPVTEKHLDEFRCFSEYNRIIDPQSKMLACNTMGMGAMANIEDIVKEVKESLTWTFPIRCKGGYTTGDSLCSGIPMAGHPGAFATHRKHSCHTGIDLYADEDTAVYAVESGKVVCIEPFTGPKDNSPWWNDTDCVLVEGATGVICYGEINPGMLKVGNNINKGMFVGRIKTVIKGKQHPEIPGWKPSMLHMEIYPHGYYKPSTGYEKDKGILIDPTPYLMEANGAPTTLLNYK